jgi:O-antigen/teichoic acid export membrane protein
VEEKAIRGVPWTMLAYVGSKALGFISTLVVAHLLLPKDFGLMALAVMATSFLSWFGDMGFSRTLVLRRDLDRPSQGTLFTLILGSSVAAALLCAAIAPLAALAFNQPRLTGVLAVLGIALIPGGLASFYEALLERELEFRRRFIGYGAQSLSSAIVSIALAVAGAGVWSLVAGQLFGAVVFALILGLLVPYRVRPRLDRQLARSLLHTSKGFLSQGVSNFLRVNADNITVAKTFGATALGYYSMAWRFADLSWTAIAAPSSRITFTAFSRARERGEDIRPSALSALRIVALIGVPFGLLLSAAADPLTRALLGHKWLPMIGPLTVLGVWAGLRPIDSFLSWLLNAVDRAWLVSWISIGILAVLVPALIVAGQLGTITTIALVVTGDLLVSIAVLTFHVRRHVALSVSALWGAIQPVILAGIPMWLATWAVGHALVAAHPLLSLIAAILAGLVVYVAVIALLDRRFLTGAGMQVMRMFGRAGSTV